MVILAKPVMILGKPVVIVLCVVLWVLCSLTQVEIKRIQEGKVSRETVTDERFWRKRPDGIVFRNHTKTKLGVLLKWGFPIFCVPCSLCSVPVFRSFLVVSFLIPNPQHTVSLYTFISRINVHGRWEVCLYFRSLRNISRYSSVPQMSVSYPIP